MEPIYWWILAFGILVYFMNELQNHYSKKQSPFPFKEHFLPIVDSSIPLSPLASQQATYEAPSTVLASTSSRRNNMEGGIFGSTPPFLYVQPQTLVDNSQSFPYSISETYQSVALDQLGNLLPPNMRYARGNGRVRQVQQLY
jgi:hypothetical protein